jgi:hypothetical protein
LSAGPFGRSILIFHDLLESGKRVLGHRGQGSADVGDAGHQARTGQPGRTRRLADRAPLALRRLLGRRLVGRRVPHVTAVAPFLADRPAHLVGHLVGHAARARAHQPALEVGEGVVAPAGLAAATAA